MMYIAFYLASQHLFGSHSGSSNPQITRGCVVPGPSKCHSLQLICHSPSAPPEIKMRRKKTSKLGPMGVQYMVFSGVQHLMSDLSFCKMPCTKNLDPFGSGNHCVIKDALAHSCHQQSRIWLSPNQNACFDFPSCGKSFGRAAQHQHCWRVPKQKCDRIHMAVIPENIRVIEGALILSVVVGGHHQVICLMSEPPRPHKCSIVNHFRPMTHHVDFQ